MIPARPHAPFKRCILIVIKKLEVSRKVTSEWLVSAGGISKRSEFLFTGTQINKSKRNECTSHLNSGLSKINIFSEYPHFPARYLYKQRFPIFLRSPVKRSTSHAAEVSNRAGSLKKKHRMFSDFFHSTSAIFPSIQITPSNHLQQPVMKI